MKKLVWHVFLILFFVFLVSSQATAETCGAPYSNWPTETPPPTGTLGAPTGIVATPGDAAITLSWNAVTGATGYRIIINNGTSLATKVVSGTSTTLSGTIGSITISNGTTYQIKIQTQNKSDLDEDQYGPLSSIVCATPSATAQTTTTTTTTTPTTTTTTTPTTTTTTTVTTTTTTTTTTTLPPLPTCQQMNQMKANAKGFDVNGDGKIDASDAALIIRYLKMNCQ